MSKTRKDTLEPVIDKFWKRVDKNGPVPNYAPHLGSCWIWTGQINNSGYGELSFGPKNDRTRVRAHRYSYETLVGPIIEGNHLDHLCRVRHCVNPSHLEDVTPRENFRRGTGWSGRNAQKTHCSKGHEFTPDNTIFVKLGRQCATCQKMKNSKIAAEAKEVRRKRALGELPTGTISIKNARSHCSRGHEFNDENTYVDPDGRRKCKPCAKMARERSKIRKAA